MVYGKFALILEVTFGDDLLAANKCKCQSQ